MCVIMCGTYLERMTVGIRDESRYCLMARFRCFLFFSCLLLDFLYLVLYTFCGCFIFVRACRALLRPDAKIN